MTTTMRPPWGRYAERAVLAEPGETIALEVTFRNADACGAERSGFTLSWGYHGPHDGSEWAKVAGTALYQADGITLHPPWIFLDPGEEVTAWYRVTLADAQPVPGYVIASIFMVRMGQESDDWQDLVLFRTDIEGTVIGVGMDYATLRAKAYSMRSVA